MDLFQGIHAQHKLTIVLVTHTSQLVTYGTRSLRMEAGRVQAASVETINVIHPYPQPLTKVRT